MDLTEIVKELIRNPNGLILAFLVFALMYCTPLATMVYAFQNSSTRIEGAVLKLVDKVDHLSDRVSFNNRVSSNVGQNRGVS